ncbi:hypothetical protein HRG_013477 [Hirsutella rhossiliensis]
MPALVVRDQGYQPLLAPMDDFPCVPPIVSFTGLIVGTGHSLLRRDLLPGLDAAQLNCLRHLPIRANPWAILSKVAGLLRHDVMLYPPGSDRDNVFIVVPDSWTFLDKAAAAVTPMTPLLSTPQRQQASSPSAAFQDMRAASLSLATPGTLPLSPPPLASASPRPAPGPPGKRCCPEPADTPTKRPRLLHKAPVPSSSPNPGSSATQSFSVSAASLTSKPDSPKRGHVLGDSSLHSIVAHGLDSPARPLRNRPLSKKATETE